MLPWVEEAAAPEPEVKEDPSSEIEQQKIEAPIQEVVLKEEAGAPNSVTAAPEPKEGHSSEQPEAVLPIQEVGVKGGAPVTDKDLEDQLSVVDATLEGLRLYKKRVASCPGSLASVSAMAAREYELKHKAAKEKFAELCKQAGKDVKQAEKEVRQRVEAEKLAAQEAAAEEAAKEQAEFAKVPTTVEEAKAKIEMLREKWRKFQKLYLHYDRLRSSGYEDVDKYIDMYSDRKLEVTRLRNATEELLIKLEVGLML